MHQRCIESGDFDMSLTYGDYNLLDQSAAHDILPSAAARNVGVFNAMVVEYGLLSGQDPRQTQASRNGRLGPHKVEKAIALWDWAQSRKVNLLSVALQYSARDERIDATLVGAANPDEVDADMAAYLQVVPEPIWAELRQRFGL
jgi:D-threo-aldose 1-dehydrogenase